MTSPLLALFTRSVREDTRSKGTYWTRIALGGFIILYLAGTAVTGNWVGATGRNFFIGIVILQAITVSLVGLSYFASAITEEKEEGTLGLLRMTNLSPLAILLGKSTSRLWNFLLLLVAQFPFTVMAVTMGGISLSQILATYCTLAAYIFLLCNVALLGSVISRRTTGAAMFTALCVTVFLGLGPLLNSMGKVLNYFGSKADLELIARDVWSISPIAHLVEVLGTGYSGGPAGLSVIICLMTGSVCFLLAWLAFDRFCGRSDTEGSSSENASRSVLGIRIRQPARPTRNALIWKDFHFMHGGRIGLAVRVACYGGALLALVISQFTKDSGGFSGWPPFLAGVTNFAFSIDFAAMAGRAFGSEIRGQTLSTLAILPLSIPRLAYLKARACLLAALPGLISFFVASLLSLFQTQGMADTGGMQFMFVAQFVMGHVQLLLLVYVVAWLSLAMKRGALPVGWVVTHAFQTLITVLGFALLSFLAYVGSKSSMAASFTSRMIDSMAMTTIAGCLISLLAIFFLHRNILRRLDGLAAEN